jgi:pyruvate kinase
VRTVYITEQSLMPRFGPGTARPFETAVADLPIAQGQLHLQRGDVIHLVADGVGHDALPARGAAPATPATSPARCPRRWLQVRKGHRIWFDDGRIGGVVQQRLRGRLVVEITQARLAGEKLAADKGINLPDTMLDLPALTPKDLEDLKVARQLRRPGGAVLLPVGRRRARAAPACWASCGASIWVVLKIETRRGFEHLPEMLLAAMASPWRA